MRALLKKDGETINVIVLEATCVPITEAERDAMPWDEFVAGDFYVLDDGVTCEREPSEQSESA